MENEVMQSPLLRNIGIFSNYVLPILVASIVGGLYYLKKKMNWKVPVLKDQDSSKTKLDTSEKLILIDDIANNMYVSKDNYTGGVSTKDSDFFTLTFDEQVHASQSYINLFASSKRPFTKFVMNKKVNLDDIQSTHQKAYSNLEKKLLDIRYSLSNIEEKIANSNSLEMLKILEDEKSYLLHKKSTVEQLIKYAKEQIEFLDYASKINRGILKQNYYFVSSDLNTEDYKNLTEDEILKKHSDSIRVELNGIKANLNNAFSKAEIMDDTQLMQVSYRLIHPVTCDDTFNKFLNSNAFSKYIYDVKNTEEGGSTDEQK